MPGTGGKSPPSLEAGEALRGRGETVQKVPVRGRRDPGLTRDSLHVILRDGAYHVISENYSYKTETYYSILSHELEGKAVRPASSSILDAYVVPICLERARLGGVPVCEWGISQAYVPVPAILYGLNYFATTSDFFVVRSNDEAKEAAKHLTNIGKYPFCYQKLEDLATLHSCIGIFGRTINAPPALADLASKVYDCFSIPLISLVCVRLGEDFFLSSLAPTRYSALSGDEHSLLLAYLSGQEFL